MILFDALDEHGWAAVSAISTGIAAAISLFGLGFVGWQIRLARKSADIDILHKFLASTAELENAFAEASFENQDIAFFNLANYLEFLAVGLEKRLFYGLSRSFIRDKLIDSLAMIEHYQYGFMLEKARSTPSALKHLFRFSRVHRGAIDQVKAGFAIPPVGGAEEPA